MRGRETIMQEYVNGVMAYVVGTEIPDIDGKSAYWKIGFDDCMEYACIKDNGKHLPDFLEWVGHFISEFNRINQEWTW